MESGMYNIQVTAQIESLTLDNTAMLIGNNGIAFVELSAVAGDAEELREQAAMLEKVNANPTMKDHERIFFALCYNLRDHIKPRYVVNLLADTIPHKRCWYYLEKWHRLGFYSSGVTADLGWFYPEKLPQRYLEIVKENNGNG